MSLAELVGAHPSMQQLRAEIVRAATSELPTVVVGETGTGKELVVQALHELSGLRGPLIAVNVATLPEALAEAELFGAVRGAYTSAYAARTGLIEAAEGGTLFLDEACDLPLTLQVKILRVLEAGRIRRLGATTERRISFRLVMTLQQDPHVLVSERRWRGDFLYRAAAILLLVPPLRERLSDLPLLCTQLAARERLPSVTPPALRELERHQWPGNVRELLRVLQRAALSAGQAQISVDHVRHALAAFQGMSPRPVNAVSGQGPAGTRAGDDRGLLLRTLAVSTTVAAAARALGITERTMYRRLRAHGINGRTPEDQSVMTCHDGVMTFEARHKGVERATRCGYDRQE